MQFFIYISDRGNDNWLIKYDKPDLEPHTDETDNAEVSMIPVKVLDGHCPGDLSTNYM